MNEAPANPMTPWFDSPPPPPPDPPQTDNDTKGDRGTKKIDVPPKH